MPLVRQGRTVEDPFVRVADGDAVPRDRSALVPAERLLAEPALFDGRTAPLGVIWPNTRRVAELAPLLDRLAVVALEFPAFKDGRAYSQARQLREQYGFAGEVRATGDVLRDQFLFLLRSGFDAFEVKKQADVGAFAAAVARYSVFYQPTGDGRLPVRRRRRAVVSPRRRAAADEAVG